MSDERTRELERAYVASGSTEDGIAYYEALTQGGPLQCPRCGWREVLNDLADETKYRGDICTKCGTVYCRVVHELALEELRARQKASVPRKQEEVPAVKPGTLRVRRIEVTDEGPVDALDAAFGMGHCGDIQDAIGFEGTIAERWGGGLYEVSGVYEGRVRIESFRIPGASKPIRQGMGDWLDTSVSPSQPPSPNPVQEWRDS